MAFASGGDRGLRAKAYVFPMPGAGYFYGMYCRLPDRILTGKNAQMTLGGLHNFMSRNLSKTEKNTDSGNDMHAYRLSKILVNGIKTAFSCREECLLFNKSGNLRNY